MYTPDTRCKCGFSYTMLAGDDISSSHFALTVHMGDPVQRGAQPSCSSHIYWHKVWHHLFSFGRRRLSVTRHKEEI